MKGKVLIFSNNLHLDRLKFSNKKIQNKQQKKLHKIFLFWRNCWAQKQQRKKREKITKKNKKHEEDFFGEGLLTRNKKHNTKFNMSRVDLS